MTDPAVSVILCPADCARSTACLATVLATRRVRLTIARARARGLLVRLDDFRLVADLRRVLRLAELRFVELRLLELRFALLRFELLRFELLRLAVPRLAELRFAVRFEPRRAADLLRDDFFAAIDVCSCRGGIVFPVR